MLPADIESMTERWHSHVAAMTQSSQAEGTLWLAQATHYHIAELWLWYKKGGVSDSNPMHFLSNSANMQTCCLCLMFLYSPGTVNGKQTVVWTEPDNNISAMICVSCNVKLLAHRHSAYFCQDTLLLWCWLSQQETRVSLSHSLCMLASQQPL